MEYYCLLPDEVVLYRKNVSLVGQRSSTELILTNKFLAFVLQTPKIFSQPKIDIMKHSIEEIKVYNDIPQLKQKLSIVDIYMISGEISVTFSTPMEAKKFINCAYELITGKTMTKRGADKVKKSINLADETLGINTVETTAEILKNGLFGGSKKKKAANIVKNVAQNIVTDSDKNDEHITSQNESNTTEKNHQISQDEKINTLKKLKELLDSGIITQEEFDAKKSEILASL